MEEAHSYTGDFVNVTNITFIEGEWQRQSLGFLVPITTIYLLIFVCGLLGNTSTCIVIARNRYMHTATNFYLFSLAISDLVLLLCGLPLEVHRLWFPATYPLGDIGCIGLGLAAETSTNATVLTIAAFTVERYIAICRPFMTRTMSKLSRAVRFIIGIWVFAICTAIPQAMQFGVKRYNDAVHKDCTVDGEGVQEVFFISGIIFFLVPMVLISVLYAQIGVKLRHSSILHPVKKLSVESSGRLARGYKSGASQRRVIRMLVAVALAFFVCWAPFHLQRLLAIIYGMELDKLSDAFLNAYEVLFVVSGILYYLSTAINPILYNIMSNKFREAFKVTLSAWFGGRGRRRHVGGPRFARTYSTLLATRRDRPQTELVGQLNGAGLRRLSTGTSQLCDAPPREQRVCGGELFTVSEGLGCGPWSLALRLRMAMLRSPHPLSEEAARSISNSSLREFEDELTGEELTTFMHQINSDIGYT